MKLKGKRIGLVCSEPLRETMAGIGIRYFEMARAFQVCGADVVLMHPQKVQDSVRQLLAGIRVVTFSQATISQEVAHWDLVIAQGYLANDIALMSLKIPKVFDFYDPWLIENLNYTKTLGWQSYYNDLASWRLQFEKGDFFLCSSEAQKYYYLGFLTALGRVNPDTLAGGGNLDHLIQSVPFGIPEKVPDYNPWIPKTNLEEKRILFGGLYDWYDPWTLLESLELLEQQNWTLWFIRNPNPETTPQQLLKKVQNWLEERPMLQQRVKFFDWVPAHRRFDLLRDVDLLVAPHRMNLETSVCMRTRYLDAIAVNCPVIASEGGAVSELLQMHQAGEVVPEQNSQALAKAILKVLWEDPTYGEQGRRALSKSLAWQKVLQPLLDFAENPSIDSSKRHTEDLKPPTSRFQKLRSRITRMMVGWTVKRPKKP